MDLFGRTFTTVDIVQFSVFFGCMTAAMVAAILGMRERSRLARSNEVMRKRLVNESTRANTFMAVASADGQVSLVWDAASHKPEMSGTLDPATGAPPQRAAFLAFGRWLEPMSAAKLEKSVERLRDNADPFSHVLTTVNGTPLEVVGLTAGGCALVRFANISAERAMQHKTAAMHGEMMARHRLLERLLDATPYPMWLRNPDGRIIWANNAYLQAIGHESLDNVHAKSAELFGSQALGDMRDAIAAHGQFAGQLPTVVNGDRVLFDTVAVGDDAGTAAIAQDTTEVDNARRELSKTIRSHEETLDGLNTAVAMFDEHKRLKFFNQSLREFWDLPPAFLETAPDMTMFLNQLRTDGKVPEMPEWQRWKNEILAQFQALQPQEDWWHLPDGRTVRVMAHPHPKGGLTWIFENFTERRDLESKFETLLRVQSETLDHLAEGVAVFGSDGYLELANPAFGEFWGLQKLVARGRIHISSIQRTWPARTPEHEYWSDIIGLVTGFADERGVEAGRFDLDDQILSWSALPLPNGQTMLTFMDMTGPDQIEKALRERNEALERTAHLRNRFIRHVSYELRAPLTNIMGFTELLAMGRAGELNAMQSAYLDNIGQSSHRLMAVTDDILDLATIDAGMLTLEVEPVDVRMLAEQASKAASDEMAANGVKLDIRVATDSGAIHGDRERLLKALGKVLSNAAAFAPDGSTVLLEARRLDGDGNTPSGVVLSVTDKGPGMDQETIDLLFERFETAPGGRRRGVGLGLPLARSLIDLHEGSINIRSRPGEGTCVDMFLPDAPAIARVAAQ